LPVTCVRGRLDAFPELTVTKPPRSPRTARPCPTSARRPAPILSSRYPGDPAKPAHRAPTLAARPTNTATPRPTKDRTPSATRHLTSQQPRGLHAEKSPTRHGLRKPRRLPKTSSGLLGPRPHPAM